MAKFYICVSSCLIACTILLVAICLSLYNGLTALHKVLHDILGNVRPIDNSITTVWSTILRIRDDTSKMTGLLDKDEDKPEETDVSGDTWALAPCPECGGNASMHYDHDSGDGYFVICSKYSRHEGCRYSIITGGSTRRLAAIEWNRNVVNYARKKVRVEDKDANTDSN